MSDGKLNRDTWPISPERVRRALQTLEASGTSAPLTPKRQAEVATEEWPSQRPAVAAQNGTPVEEISLTVAQPERYEMVGELGRGGMGRVDAVFDRALGRTIARKTILVDRGHPALLVAEAQICAQLEHPSIVPVYDLGADETGMPHYTMRVVRGRTLRQVLSDNATPDKPHLGLFQLLGILRQVCLVADYAHSRGVIHRDLKPENIIVGEFGEVYVLDWGVAHIMSTSDIRRSRAGLDLETAGSLGYMAPEQALGDQIDPRTDVFALGVILFELLTGERPFDDNNIESIRERISKPLSRPPSLHATKRITPAFDDLVTSCLEPWPRDRPASARHVAETIEAFLDGERARLEREREATAHAREGERAMEAFEALDAEARRLQQRAEEQLASISPWEPVERKQGAWALAQEGRRLASESARALARAEAAFTRALGRIPDHPDARRGLTLLYFRQFISAEARGDHEQMAQYLDLARTYDDGALGLELADQGELVVDVTAPHAEVRVGRCQPFGLLLRCDTTRAVGREPLLLDSGSYIVTARCGDIEIRYPLLIERAKAHRLTLRIPTPGEVPEGMIVIPGGPFLAYPPRTKRAVHCDLPDFAIGRFPVTFREYAEFLDAIADPAERERRTPGHGPELDPLLLRDEHGWRISARCVEGEARRRVVPERELDLPVHEISWYDALAYTRWLARRHGRPFRLPTDMEWEKALRGADGRSFPMGEQLDASFAKLRESRPEASQPEVVGAFEDDCSPYGVRDLAGGVADWTSTSLDAAPLPDLSEEGTPAADQRQAIWRGGTWGTTASASRIMRYSQMVRHRSVLVGFRVALGLDDNGSSRLEVTPLSRARA